jgi:glutamate dehydrogenase/leucine dehydrogenase
VELGGRWDGTKHRPRPVSIVTLGGIGEHLGFESRGHKIAVQGFGNVGPISAKYTLAEAGAKIVAITTEGRVYNGNRLDLARRPSTRAAQDVRTSQAPRRMSNEQLSRSTFEF